MLTHTQALQHIAAHVHALRSKRVPTSQALGLSLAKAVVAPEPFPSFDNSAVDGYALGSVGQASYPIVGEVKAGDRVGKRLKATQACRIFTGAPVPAGTRAVVMVEHTECTPTMLTVQHPPKVNANIRLRGEDFGTGAVLLEPGTRLEPQHLALLTAVGIRAVSVVPAAQVAVLATGSELVSPATKPRPGQIRASNDIMLQAMLLKLGATPDVLPTVGDSLPALHSRVKQGLKSAVFLISGGVSVGKYDHVREALKQHGVREIFWKVDIKPGKPLYFGKKGKTLVFGLPGNPVSVFVTFEEFVKPALLALMGRPTWLPNGAAAALPMVPSAEQQWIEGSLTHDLSNGPRLHFLRVQCTHTGAQWRITPLQGQGSHQLGALAQANGLLHLPPDATLKKGQTVRAKLI